VRGYEERVIVAFCSWLEREGWSVEREVTFVDVLAQKDGVTVYAEVKGRTTLPGLDVDGLRPSCAASTQLLSCRGRRLGRPRSHHDHRGSGAPASRWGVASKLPDEK